MKLGWDGRVDRSLVEPYTAYMHTLSVEVYVPLIRLNITLVNLVNMPPGEGMGPSLFPFITGLLFRFIRLAHNHLVNSKFYSASILLRSGSSLSSHLNGFNFRWSTFRLHRIHAYV